MASAAEADIEALKREREEKQRQIADKKRQVEELKSRRAQRTAAKGPVQRKDSNLDLNKSIDDLLADMLGGQVEQASYGGSPERPLQELARSRTALRKDARAFQTDRVATVSMEPHQGDVYEKSVQTDVDEDAQASRVSQGAANVLQKMRDKVRSRTITPQDNVSGSTRTIKRSIHPTSDGGDPGVPGTFAEQIKAIAAEEDPVKELSDEEKKTIESTPDFQNFFKRTSLLVERSLGQEAWDIAADFAGYGDTGDNDSTQRMKHVDDYFEERWSVSRPVADVRFSPHRNELFLAAYGQKANPSLSDPDGCALVWNLAMQRRPEMSFSCQSAVLTAHFHRFNPALFFGGTYSGGIVLWDARAKTGPVQRTPLSAKGHSHPVQAMQQVGTQNATNLVTASNDGRLCTWSLAMLAQPQESIDLKNEKSSNRRDLAVMSLSFPENETNILYVGAEDGSVCQVHIHGTKVGVTESYDGHEGPVTCVDMHPHGDASQHGGEMPVDLALTSSFDWSVKMWSVKQYQSPVLSLDLFEDYIYDVRWHPTHPAMFSTVDGEGHVDLWNLNKDMESPVVRCERPNQGQQRLALNRCYWSMDGRRLTTGDSEGTLSVYALDKTAAQPRNEDFTQFQERIRSLQPIVPRTRDSGGYGLDSRYGLGSRGGGYGLDSSGGRY